MPFIQYPNIPNVAGVPVLNRLSGFLSIPTPSLTPLPNVPVNTGNQQTPWMIIGDDNRKAIQPDSMLIVDARADSKIATHPIEKGQFAAYNKTQMPNEVRVTMTCSGSGAMSRSEFLATLEAMKRSIKLYSICTPDNVYMNMNMTHYDNRREASKGAMMIIAEAWFQEVRETATATYTTTQKPEGSQVKNNGQLTAQTPTAAQTNPFLIGVVQ